MKPYTCHSAVLGGYVLCFAEKGRGEKIAFSEETIKILYNVEYRRELFPNCLFYFYKRDSTIAQFGFEGYKGKELVEEKV